MSLYQLGRIQYRTEPLSLSAAVFFLCIATPANFSTNTPCFCFAIVGFWFLSLRLCLFYSLQFFVRIITQHSPFSVPSVPSDHFIAPPNIFSLSDIRVFVFHLVQGLLWARGPDRDAVVPG